MRALVEQNGTIYRWRGEDGSTGSGFATPAEAAIAAYQAGARSVADLDRIRRIRAQQAEQHGWGSEPGIGFEFEGIFGYDPAMDGSGRVAVDPVTEYARPFWDSRFLAVAAIPMPGEAHF